MQPRFEICRLEEAEREALFKTIEKIADRRKVVAACAYGSRVAGYAKSDSDYDVIIVLENYRAKIRYRYVKFDVDASALLVDRSVLLKDAENSSLGEFAVGRLLNIYEPLVGGDFFWMVERIYKKRVILEHLDEILFSHGEFSSELIINVDYFLFEKLKKRATIYPPALYSYVKTYGGCNGESNLEASRAGFIDALEELESEGLLRLEDGKVRIQLGMSKGDRSVKLPRVFSDTARGIAQYAVHGYAGRVGLKVVGGEALSKLVRHREIGEIPELLKQPKALWSVEEGALIVDSEDWLREIAQYLGLNTTLTVRKKQLGELYNVSNVYLLDDGSKVEAVAVKKFRDIRSVKWALLNIWTLPTRRFNMSPLARMNREYSMIRRLRRLGLNTPEIVGVVLNDRILVTRYIDGIDLGRWIGDILDGVRGELTPIELYGETLAKVHASDNTLGDTKPSNAVYYDGRIYLTDLEQANIGWDKSWDVAEFIYYSTKLTLNQKGAVEVMRSFLEGYLKSGNLDVVKDVLDVKYVAPFQPFLAPTVAVALRNEIERMLRK